MTDFSLSSAYNASKLASNHARSKGEDASQLQFVSGLIMAFMGCRMAMDAFNRMQAGKGGRQMGGRGR